MTLKPKHSLHTLKLNKNIAVRQFTDREEPQRTFKRAMQEKDDNPRVLVYYGIGGIGKSRLLKELKQQSQQYYPNSMNAFLDFKEVSHHSLSRSLIHLREQLKTSHRVTFPTFDLAYAVYWKKLHPEMSLKSQSKELPFIEEGSFVGDLINQLENIPLAHWLPKTLKLIHGLSKYKESINWWFGRGKQVLEQLEEMLPGEIEERLSLYWALDLKDYLQQKPKPAVLFIDTYEALLDNTNQQGHFLDKDEWIRQLVLQLPEVLWVICGRDKIQWGRLDEEWEEYIEQHLIGELSKVDSEQFLLSCGIEDPAIRNTIMDTSKGLPYYLDVLIDTFFVLKATHTPTKNELTATRAQMTQRLLQYLSKSEQETLKLLALPRFWDLDLFQSLVNTFNTGYPITSYTELFRFSFISERENQAWSMHTIMRESLRKSLQQHQPILYQKVHDFLLQYYENQLRTVEHKSIPFQEGMFHAFQNQPIEQAVQWTLREGTNLKNNGDLLVLVEAFPIIEEYLTNDIASSIYGEVYKLFGETFALVGEYHTAETLYSKSIDILQKTEGTIGSYASVRVLLGELMVHQSQYEQALTYFQNALHLFSTYGAMELEEASVHLHLGKLIVRFGDYSQAVHHYKEALQLCDKVEEVQLTYVIKGIAYEKLGECAADPSDSQQEKLYERSILYLKKAVQKEYSFDQVLTMKQLGLSYKRLAEHYYEKQQWKKAISIYGQAIAIYNQVLQLSPCLIDVLEKKGHASVDCMKAQVCNNQWDKAINSFELAKAAFEEVLELSPTQGGSRNRLASAYRELGILYARQEKWDMAMASFEQAKMKHLETLRYTPTYIYSQNSLGKTYYAWGEAYEKQQNKLNAIEAYSLALQSFKEMLTLAPGTKEAVQYRNALNSKMRALKKL
ncbi:tetratricopeptide repeat protein [Pontibacillus salicampi]|uniref:Tetratricopeptide repeat protein n=1 Tax=Pontibacillus salicampi TaxID=1449801 RepID=A0ABV6LR65_9BACI